MLKKKGFLVQLLGTATKIKILEQLSLDPTPLTKHALSKISGNGIGPTYDQVEQLVALGAVKEVNGKVMMDSSFPFYDDVVNIVVSMVSFMNQQTLLNRIDTLFGNDYYITGYLAARQNGPPVDHDQDSALITVLNPNAKSSIHLMTLFAVSPTELVWHPTEGIPDDITRQDIYDANVWIASVERGLVDCYQYKDCTTYVTALLLLQNIMNGSIKISTLVHIAEDNGVGDDFIILLSGLNKAAGKELVPLNAKDVIDGEKKLDAKLISDLVEAGGKAYNTLMGG